MSEGTADNNNLSYHQNYWGGKTVKYANFFTKAFLIAFLLIAVQSKATLQGYTVAEGCEIGLAAARLPLAIASKTSANSNNPKRALILDMITHATRSMGEILHMYNQPNDIRHNSYACIAYDLERSWISAKKLYALDATKPQAAVDTKKALHRGRDILLPAIESLTALFRATYNQDDRASLNNRIVADSIGAITRSYANLIEDDQSTPEKIFATAYLIYSVCFALNDGLGSPAQPTRRQNGNTGDALGTAEQLTQEQIAALGLDRVADVNYELAATEVPPLPGNAVLNHDCPILFSEFENNERVWRFACGHAASMEASRSPGFAASPICPFGGCRDRRKHNLEHAVNYHPTTN